METESEQLMVGCQRKDPKAQKRLYDKYAPKLLGLCMRYTHSRDEAQDLLHDGFIKIFESIDTLSSSKAFEQWMFQIMTNICLNYLTRNCNLLYSDLNAMDEFLPAPEEEEEEPESYNDLSMEQIVNAIQTLPPRYRLIFNLCEVEERDTKDVAAIMDMNENNIRQLLLRARLLLRNKLKNRINTI